MILILITSFVCVAGIGVNMVIVFRIMTSEYKKTVFDLGTGNDEQVIAYFYFEIQHNL